MATKRRIFSLIFQQTTDYLRMKFKLFMSLLASALLLTWSACDKESGEEDYLSKADCSSVSATDNTYAKTIKPIIDVSCALSGCHDAKTKSHNIDMSAYAGAKSAFTDHEGLCSINHGSGCDPMPQNGSKLPDATIKLITCWVKSGYPQ